MRNSIKDGFIFASGIFTMIGDVLTKVSVTNVAINAHADVDSYDVLTENNEEVNIPGDAVFYSSEKRFSEGVSLDESCGTIKLSHKMLATDADTGTLYTYAWSMENGEPKLTKHYLKGVIYSKGFDWRTGFIFEDGSHPTKDMYETRDKCLAWNDYKVSTKDGVKVRTGIAKRIALTPEQKELVDQFLALEVKLREANVEVFCDNDNQSMMFVNKENIKDCCSYWEGDADDSMKNIDDYVYWASTKICYHNCDNRLYVTLNEE